jgi:AmmeMemoRadiSam system protein A
MEASLTPAEKQLLLQMAREALEAAVTSRPLPRPAADRLPVSLAAPASCFVTLTAAGELRGCIGSLQAERPLFEEVRLRAGQAALSDFRFAPVAPEELPGVEVEISVLTPPQPLEYAGPDDLMAKLRPGVDGVILARGKHRATFLPQVWERVPDPQVFLSMLCEKLGAAPEAWRQAQFEVYVYQVLKFTEAEFQAEGGIGSSVPRAED